MRKNFLRIAVMAVFALVSICASAQESFKLSGNEGDFTIYYQMSEETIISNLQKGQEVRILKSSQGDSIFIVDRYYVDNEKYLVKEEKITVERRKVLPSTWGDQVRNTQVVEKLYDDCGRDTYSAKAEDGSTAVLKSTNKDGWAASLYAGYEYFNSINAPVFGAGVEFTQPWFLVSVSAEVGMEKYTDFAVHAGEKYINYRTSALLGVQPFKFDKYNQNRLFLVGGVKFKFSKTDTPEEEGESWINSWGSYLSPMFGVKFEHRMFATGNSWWIEATAEQSRGIINNHNDDLEWGFGIKDGFSFGVGRNKVKNVSNAELKRLKNL